MKQNVLTTFKKISNFFSNLLILLTIIYLIIAVNNKIGNYNTRNRNIGIILR